MKLTQNWVGYLDRSYEQIKRSCLKRLGVQAPEISDHSESNPLIIILSMFAGIAEMLNLYIDSNARESFLGTARRYTSAVKLVKLIDYNIRARNAATANIFFQLVDTDGNPIALPSGTVTIPKDHVITDPTSGLKFRMLADAVIPAGQQNVYGRVIQSERVVGDIIGNTDGSNNQSIAISDAYVDGTMKLTIAGDTWTLYRSFGLMGPLTKGFIVNIDEDQTAYIQFGDGINGKVPLTGQTIFGTYDTSAGASGNLPPDAITVIAPGIVTPVGINLLANNPDYSSGGTDFEGLEDIQNRAPRSIRTLDRAVTYQDYLDLCYLVLGVGAAEVSYCCGKYVDIYIAPSSPGSASLTLLQSVKDFLLPRVMITTQISVKPAGLSKIWIKAKVYGKPLKTSAEIYDQVVTELDNKFGFGTLKINNKVSIPDISAAVDNLANVDRMEIEEVRILPFARGIDNNLNILNIEFLTLPHTNIRTLYSIIYKSGTNNFDVYKNNYLVGTIAIGAAYVDAAISFKINAGVYADNNKWEFEVAPSYPEIFPLGLIEIKDFSAAIIEVGPLIDPAIPRTIYSDITIIPQGTEINTLPPCNE